MRYQKPSPDKKIWKYGHSELIFKWEHFKYNQKKIQAEKVDPSPVFSHSTSIWALQTQILNFSG